MTNGSLGAGGVAECWYPRCWAAPVLTNHPRALPWFAWAPAGEPWPGARHSRYFASSWKSFWCLTGNSATQGCLSLGANSSASFQRCAAAGAGESGKQLHLDFIPTSYVCASLFIWNAHSCIGYFVGTSGLSDRGCCCVPQTALSTHAFFFPLPFDPSFLKHKSECSNFSPELFPTLFLICILNHVLNVSYHNCKSCY